MDEAGRGPALGPIVFGLVGATQEEIDLLKSRGVNDSKKLSHQQREKYKEIIEANVSTYDVRIVKAEIIDEQRLVKTLNEIEVDEFRKLLRPFKSQIDKLYLDAADVNAERFGSNFYDFAGKRRVVSEHKADATYTIVGAASILAKVKRDEIITQYRRDYEERFPDLPMFTAGYPQDAKAFLKAYVSLTGKLPSIARKSWKTCSKTLEEYSKSQQSLDDFF